MNINLGFLTIIVLFIYCSIFSFLRIHKAKKLQKTEKYRGVDLFFYLKQILNYEKI